VGSAAFPCRRFSPHSIYTRVLSTTTTVRISERAHEHLRELAVRSGRPLQAVLESAIEAFRRDAFFVQLDAAYQAVWADEQAGREEQEERAVWESTLADGLAD
jgi:predicted transcriptional regulator